MNHIFRDRITDCLFCFHLRCNKLPILRKYSFDFSLHRITTNIEKALLWTQKIQYLFFLGGGVLNIWNFDAWRLHSTVISHFVYPNIHWNCGVISLSLGILDINLDFISHNISNSQWGSTAFKFCKISTNHSLNDQQHEMARSLS